MPTPHPHVTADGDGMDTIAARFHQAWSDSDDEPFAPHALLPSRLSHAILKVLPADGAGLSFFNDDFRVPLAATSAYALAAERLQFTLGEGPCLSAAGHEMLVAADMEELAEHWPVYADELRTKTPYCAVITLPLALGPGRGAIDLYFNDTGRLREVRLADAAVVATATVDAMMASLRGSPQTTMSGGSDRPTSDWLAATPARERLEVWIAIGILVVKAGVDTVDALDLLRSYAYSRGRSLDELAAELVAGDIDPAHLQQ